MPVSVSRLLISQGHLPYGGPSGLYSLAPIVGRKRIHDELRQRLLDPDTRILTVTGPSGIGKSRLAVALFHDVVAEFDGGCYVDAADTGDDLLVALAAAVGAEDGPAATAFDRLVERVGQRRVLIVIDSAEQLLESTRSVVVSIAATCWNVAVLVITIEKIGVYGEYVVRLRPLEVPDRALTDLAALGAVPSVKLLLYRVRALRSGFQLTEENRDAVAGLCRRVDGMPLALELAAERLQLISPQDLVNELDKVNELDTVADRLHGRREGMPWHSELHASFEKGWQRLDENERGLLRRLAAFAGDFSHTDVVVMADPDCLPVERLLARLVDKSLLLPTEHPSGDITFRMLRLTRDCLLAIDDDHTWARRRHAEHILAMAESRATQHGGAPHPPAPVVNLVAYESDVHAAIEFLVGSGDGVAAGRLVVAMVWYWTASGNVATALHHLRQILAMHDLPDRLRTQTIASLGRCAMATGDWDAAEEYLSTAASRYEAAGDPAGRLASRHALAQLAHRRGDDTTAKALLVDVAHDYGQLGDLLAQAAAVADLAGVHHTARSFGQAQRLAAEALEVFLAARDSTRAASTRLVLAAALNGAGEHECAERHSREALQLARQCDDRYGMTLGVITHAWISAIRHGRATEAWRRVALLLGTVSADLAAMSMEPPRHLAEVLDGLLGDARARLGSEAFEAARQRGASRNVTEAVDEALAPLHVSRLPTQVGAGGVLTLREQEVAELVSAGLTNREISRRLGIAEWTVVNHMRKVMRKLRCTSRVQVAGWVSDHRTPETSASGTPAEARLTPR